MRRAERLTIPLVMAAALAAATPAPASAGSPVRVVCAVRAPLLETPGGLVVGSVTRDDRVVVLKRARRWVRVRTEFSTRGWIRAGHLCRG